jgi:hypothetical protein
VREAIGTLSVIVIQCAPVADEQLYTYIYIVDASQVSRS